MKYLDLSVAINNQTPVYEGDPITKVEPNAILAHDGYEDHYVSIGTHAGTHVDAPIHMIKDGKTLDLFPLEKFSGRGVYIKINGTFDFAVVKKARIQENDIVLFDTGMSKVYHKPTYYDKYPAITEEIAKYLIEKKVKIIGVDMCSVDHEPFPVHKLLLKEEILIIENLTNLSALKNKEFTVYAFPLKLQIDGSPTRVVAQIK